MKISSDLLTFPFREAGWERKALTGGALVLARATFVLFPLGWMLSGYHLRVLRETLRTGQPGLPDWSEPRELFMDGLRLWLVGMVYSLPVTLPYFFVLALFGGALLGTLFSPDVGSIAALMGMISVASFCITPLYPLILPLTLLIAYLQSVAILRVVVEGRFEAALEFRQVWRMAWAHWKQYLVAGFVLLAVFMGLGTMVSFSLYTVVLACLYPILLAFTGWYGTVLSGTLYGLAHREAQVGAPGEAAPLATPSDTR